MPSKKHFGANNGSLQARMLEEKYPVLPDYFGENSETFGVFPAPATYLFRVCQLAAERYVSICAVSQ